MAIQRRRWHPTPVLLPGKSHEQRSLVGYSPWGRKESEGFAKSRTRLSNFTFTFHFHALEKEMATHSSVLAWRIPGTGEPGGLPSWVTQSRTWLKRLSSSSSHGNQWRKKKIIWIQIGKDIKVLLFADDMILCIENSKVATRKLLELINEFGKLAGYKISAQKSIAVLYTNKER